MAASVLDNWSYLINKKGMVFTLREFLFWWREISNKTPKISK